MSCESEISLLSKLQSQLISFLDELIETFPKEPDFVIFRIFVKDKLPIIDIMTYIIKNLCPLHEMVKNRNEQFFLNYNVLFEKFGEGESTRVNKFKQLWLSNQLEDDEKEAVWQWFNSFIILGNSYMELKKKV